MKKRMLVPLAIFAVVAAMNALGSIDVIPLPAEIRPADGCCPVDVAVREVVKPSLGAEAYELEITPGEITAFASGKAGFFYARQTLGQLKFGRKEIPCMRIADAPRFGWRSLHLDVSRHFFTAAQVKRFIDLMARFKFNTFHWHLVDSHGWRMEVPKYPDLVTRGAWRHDGNMDRGGKPYGGYYTTAELQDVVAYAAARCVTVVPEIEIPGHSAALTYACPFLACDEREAARADACAAFLMNPTRNWKRFQSCHPKIFSVPDVKVSPDVCCVGKESTFGFYEDVLDEVMRIFPSKYIHIGGDEVQTKYWEKCPACRARVKEIGGEDVKSLMPYTATRIAKYLQAHGRQALGWDDILDGGMPAGTVVQSWRGESGAIKAARQGVKCILSANRYLYFNESQSPEHYEPDAYPGFLPLALVYGYDPVPKQVRKMGRADCILGVEACHWSEYINSEFQLDVQAWPRALAVAELGWCRPEAKNVVAFEGRVEQAKKLLASLGVEYWDAENDYHGWDLYDNDPLPTLKTPARPDTPSEAFMKEARRLYPRKQFADYKSNIVERYIREYSKKGDDIHSLETGLGWKHVPHVHNVRDLGGWNGLRTGLVFRGSQLYTNEVGGVSESTRAALRELGIRSEIDLRGRDECEPKNKETLNFDRVGLKRIPRQIVQYMRAWADADAKKAVRAALLEFTKEENYPIYFHCKAGADRTGTLAFILEGLCGVRETDIAIDYELTSFAKLYGVRCRNVKWIGEQYDDSLKKMFDLVKAYPGYELRDKFAAMVRDCFGLTDAQIEFIRGKLCR